MKEYTERKISIATRIVLAIAYLGLLAILVQEDGRNQSLNDINTHNNVYLAACWAEAGLQEYVPTIFPTQDFPDWVKQTEAAEQMDREHQIRGTQEALQSLNEASNWLEMGEEYMEAVVRYEVKVPVETEGDKQWAPYYSASALMVGAEYGKEDDSDRDVPIWIFLTSNHAVDGNLIALMENDEIVGFEFKGVDINSNQIDAIPMYSQLVGCRKIIADGQHVATLLAVKGRSGIKLDGSSSPYTDYFYPFPVDRIGGPCTLGSEGMKMVSFPANGDGTSPQPLLSEIHRPYSGFRGISREGGVSNIGINGTGLMNLGSSGGSLLDPESGNICAVVNFIFPNDITRIGFNVLPDRQFMEEQIKNFLQEQIEISSSGN